MSTATSISKAPVRRFVPTQLAMLGIIVVHLLLGCGSKVAVAQAVPDNIPASLLRRLAEAADAHRTGAPVWLVVQPEEPHSVADVYASFAAAQADTMLARGYRVYGPFVTPIDFGMDREFIMPCPHSKRPTPSMYFCGEAIALDSIVTMKMLIETTTRGLIEYSMSPDSVDVIFMNVSAFDKFAAPYYTLMYGAAFTETLRQMMLTRILEGGTRRR